MKKLLVTGVSGFLGWNICRVASRQWEIFGTIFSHQVKLREVNTIQVNLVNFEEIKRLFRAIRPDLDSSKAFTLGFKPRALAGALQEISRAI